MVTGGPRESKKDNKSLFVFQNDHLYEIYLPFIKKDCNVNSFWKTLFKNYLLYAKITKRMKRSIKQ